MTGSCSNVTAMVTFLWHYNGEGGGGWTLAWGGKSQIFPPSSPPLYETLVTVPVSSPNPARDQEEM